MTCVSPLLATGCNSTRPHTPPLPTTGISSSWPHTPLLPATGINSWRTLAQLELNRGATTFPDFLSLWLQMMSLSAVEDLRGAISSGSHGAESLGAPLHMSSAAERNYPARHRRAWAPGRCEGARLKAPALWLSVTSSKLPAAHTRQLEHSLASSEEILCTGAVWQ